MKSFVSLLFVLLSFNVSVMDIYCEAWSQQNGGSLNKSLMNVESSTADNIVYSATHEGFEFKVDWNFELTSLYTTVRKNGNTVLFTTARVPSENHRDSFTDLKLPNGLRLSVNCEIQ